MKYFLILILFSQILLSSEIEDKFKWKERAPLIDFIGCIKANDKIIAYGTNASYLYSTDKGNTWNQSKIDGIDVITKLEYVDNQILGFSLDGHSLKSDDYGVSWQINYLEKLDSAYCVLFNSGYFIVRDKNSINILDKQFNIISTYKEAFLWTQDGKYTTDSRTHRMVIQDDKLYFNSKSNKLISIKVSDFIQNKLTINQTNICDSCYNGIGLLHSNDNLYLDINMNTPSKFKTQLYYHYSISSNTFKELSNSEYYQYYGEYFSLDSNIYQFKSIGTGKTVFDYFQFQFNKYNISKNEFEKISISPMIPTNLYFSPDKITDMILIDNNTIMAVANNKTIVKSTNLGQSWEVVTSINNFIALYPSFIFNDSLELYQSSITKTYFSYNEGITYQPIIYDIDANLRDQYSASNIKSYIGTNNEIITINDNKEDKVDNIALTNDLCKTYTMKSVERIKGISNHIYFNKVGNKYIIISNKDVLLDLAGNKKNYIIYTILDSNLKFLGTQTDSINYAYLALFKDENSGFAVSGVTDSLGFSIVILKRNSSKNEWERKAKQYIKLTDVSIYELGNSKDSVLIVGKHINGGVKTTTLYIYVNITGTFEKIYENTANEEPKIFFGLENKFFLAGLNFFMESNDRSNLRDWKKHEVNDGSDWLWLNTSRDSKFQLVKYSSPTKGTSVFKIQLNSKSDIESSLINNNTNYFQSMPPFPIPAMNELKSLIYWDMSYNIDDSDIEVYDIYGNKVADNDKISINKLNSYSGYLNWDCSGIATGVYMIQIKHGTNNYIIRAMVVR
jgi:hypothetical protein